MQLTTLATLCRYLVERARADGLVVNDSNVVDLVADHTWASLSDIRDALVVAGLAPQFPNSTRSHGD